MYNFYFAHVRKLIQFFPWFSYREGKIVTLKEEESDVDTQKLYRNRSNYVKHKKPFGTAKYVSGTNDEKDKQQVRTRIFKKRVNSNAKTEDNNSVISNEITVRKFIDYN